MYGPEPSIQGYDARRRLGGEPRGGSVTFLPIYFFAQSCLEEALRRGTIVERKSFKSNH